MSVNVEKMEKNLAKLTIEIPLEDVEKAIDKIYAEEKKKIQIPGFRRGRAPRKMVEQMYGKGMFLEDAVNNLVPDAYESACTESGLDIVSQPQIAYTQVEPEKPVIFTATVAVRPGVELGEYRGLEVETEPVEVTDEDIMKELEQEQEKNAVTRTVEDPDRRVEDGDLIALDFDGTVDGVAFEGGHGEDVELTIGSHSFVDNFEEQLIGAAVGEARDVHVVFPGNYQRDLAGKPALFKTVVKAIKEKELPELDDEFASEVSEFETLEEYKEDVRKNLLEKKEQEAKTAKEDALVAAVVENSQMEIPDLMVESQARAMVDEFAQRLEYQGMTLDAYLQYAGLTEREMIEQNKDAALKQIQNRLVLEEIASVEKLEATEEEIEAERQKIADEYGMELEQVKEYMTDDQLDELKQNIAVQKAVDIIYDAAKE